jgi:MFS transporter, ACS family, aldohexuronate transporter
LKQIGLASSWSGAPYVCRHGDARTPKQTSAVEYALPDHRYLRPIPNSFSFRWLAVSVFILSSTLNYLDRNLLSLLAPLMMAELHFNQTQFGELISVFSIFYAASSLGTGWMLDRFGINRTISGAVAWWSLAAIGNGLARNFGGLAVSRAAMGIGESAGVPAVGKLNGIYLKPGERALGAAANQIGLSLSGLIGPLWIAFALTHGWRAPFVISGAFGLLWIPVWLAVNKWIPAEYSRDELVSANTDERSSLSILGDRNLLLLVLANLLWMSGYSLWSNWTTLYLVHVQKISLHEAAYYLWIPPLFSNVGGFFGGWLSLRWIKRQVDPLIARRRAVWLSALCSLLTLFLPLAPNAGWATAGISLSFFFSVAGSANIYALPIDIYGPGRSGVAISALTGAYGILQTVISPLIGKMGDRNLYPQVVWMATLPLLLSALALSGCTVRKDPAQSI